LPSFCVKDIGSLKNYFKVYGGLQKEIYIFFIARVITCMGMFIMPLWALILTQKIGLTKPEAGLMSTVFAVTQAPCLLFGGKLIDRIGRKKFIFLSQFVGAVIYIACAVLPLNMRTAVLIIIAADFYSAASPALDALVADITTPENRKATFSLIYFGLNLGYTVSPLIGGLLFQRHLSVLFILDAVTTLISITIIMLYIKEPEPKKKEEALPQTKEGREEKTSVWNVLLANRVLLYFLTIMFIYHFCYSQWSFMLPLQMADLFGGNGARNYSFLVAANAVTVIALTPLATARTRKFRALTVAAAGGLGFFASFFLFGLISRLPLFFIAVIILTVGEILVTVNTNAFIADHTPSSHRGRVNSLHEMTRGTCYAISPPIMGSLIVATSYLVSWWMIAALMLTGALSMFALDRKHSREAEKTGTAF